MLPWMSDTKQPLVTRPVQHKDIDVIMRLVQASSRSYIHPDWRSLAVWIGRGPAFITENQFGAIGCLIASVDPPPAAWIRLATVAPGYRPGDTLKPLLSASMNALANDESTSLAAMPVTSWLPPVLENLGFEVVQHIATWEKHDLDVPHLQRQNTVVRPAQQSDMPRLAEIDRAAFVPRWRLSIDALSSALEKVAFFSVAEQTGNVVGFQFSQISGNSAHLVRLTVDPSAQRRGVGGQLLGSALESFRKVGLSSVSLNTQVDNKPSHHLYRAFGFTQTSAALPIWERSLTQELH